jgi:hypothetical protein
MDQTTAETQTAVKISPSQIYSLIQDLCSAKDIPEKFEKPKYDVEWYSGPANYSWINAVEIEIKLKSEFDDIKCNLTFKFSNEDVDRSSFDTEDKVRGYIESKSLGEYISVCNPYQGREGNTIAFSLKKISKDPMDFLKKLDNAVTNYKGWRMKIRSGDLIVHLNGLTSQNSIGISTEQPGGVNFDESLYAATMWKLILSKLEQYNLDYKK